MTGINNIKLSNKILFGFPGVFLSVYTFYEKSAAILDLLINHPFISISLFFSSLIITVIYFFLSRNNSESSNLQLKPETTSMNEVAKDAQLEVSTQKTPTVKSNVGTPFFRFFFFLILVIILISSMVLAWKLYTSPVQYIVLTDPLTQAKALQLKDEIAQKEREGSLNLQGHYISITEKNQCILKPAYFSEGNYAQAELKIKQVFSETDLDELRIHKSSPFNPSFRKKIKYILPASFFSWLHSKG